MTSAQDDWPYPSPVLVPRAEQGPTWACPDLTCECNGGAGGEQDPNPPPATPSGPVDSRWLVLQDHFGMARDVFRAAYEFFVAEYTDSNAHLGPPPPANTPTPLDDANGHFIIHPDYGRINHGVTAAGTPKQNGRQAHFNHIHAQLGPT